MAIQKTPTVVSLACHAVDQCVREKETEKQRKGEREKKRNRIARSDGIAAIFSSKLIVRPIKQK